jgi:hypothetical protein
MLNPGSVSWKCDNWIKKFKINKIKKLLKEKKKKQKKTLKV